MKSIRVLRKNHISASMSCLYRPRSNYVALFQGMLNSLLGPIIYCTAPFMLLQFCHSHIFLKMYYCIFIDVIFQYCYFNMSLKNTITEFSIFKASIT